jgi:hypothetical protein
MKTAVRLFGVLFIISLVFLSISPSIQSDETKDCAWWDDTWSYRQSIVIPIDTSDKDAIYHPIDIFFEFEDACWAEDETKHSVRVIYQQGMHIKELESQIYNLKYSGDNHIQSCGLVFLIPEIANGQEKYYVYYDNKETPMVDYPDRVRVEDSYFSYEPIGGILTETWAYNIMQGTNIVYSVAKEGIADGEPTSQQVAKMKEGATSLLPNMGENTVSYGMRYWYKNQDWETEQTMDKLVKSEIIIDGNLMVKIGIISESNSGLLRSTVYHKYYYSPGIDKSIYSDVRHEALGDLPKGREIEVEFMIMTSGMLRSSIINELNFGNMPKYIHFYSDEEFVKIHQIDPYPEGPFKEIIGLKDGYSLGSIPWVSFDDGKTGEAHGIVLDSIDVVSSGKNERDGVRLMLHQGNVPNLPGLDGRVSFLSLSRNSSGSKAPPNDYVVEFRSFYHSTKDGGYPKIEKQAEFYHSLVDFQPKYEGEITGEEKKQDYNLTVYTHANPNLLLKMMSSRFLLKNSYFHVEILHNDVVVGFKQSGKIPLTDKGILGIGIDWRNVSFFRKAVFNHQIPRKYVLKVYLVNPIIGDKREFVGFKVVDLKEDTAVRIFCKQQGKISLLFTDQNNQGLKDVDTLVLKDDDIIHKVSCNENGETLIGLPAGIREKYDLNSFYKGFLIDNQQISITSLNNMFPVKKTIDVEAYDFKVEVDYASGKKPDFDIEVSLISGEMQYPVTLTPDRFENGIYYFEKLIPASYNLSIKYDSIKATEKINIPEENSFKVTLHDFSLYLKDVWGFPFESYEALVFVRSPDFDEPFTVYANQIAEGNYRFSYIYPGDYFLFVNYRSVVLQHNISIPITDDMIELVFPTTFNITTTVFDSHGNFLSDAKIKLIRNGEEISEITGKNGAALLSAPPGEYLLKILYNDEIVAQRRVDVLNDRELSIVTIKEPWQPYAVIIFSIISLIGIGFYSYKHKKSLFFLKCLSITLIFIALFVPWWSISGSLNNPASETVTNLYIIPNNMVTITTSNDVISGSIAIMDEMFTFVIDVILYLSILVIGLIVLNIVIKSFTNLKKIPFLTLFMSIVLMLGCITAFFVATSMLSEATVGSIFGSGTIDVIIYGENTFEQIPCNWNLNIGFYCFIFSTFLLASIFLYKIKNFIKKRFCQ